MYEWVDNLFGTACTDVVHTATLVTMFRCGGPEGVGGGGTLGGWFIRCAWRCLCMNMCVLSAVVARSVLYDVTGTALT